MNFTRQVESIGQCDQTRILLSRLRIAFFGVQCSHMIEVDPITIHYSVPLHSIGRAICHTNQVAPMYFQ